MASALEVAKDWLPVVVFLGTVVGLIASGVWRYFQLTAQNRQILKAIGETRTVVKKLASQQAEILKTIDRLESDVRVRERDGSKLEGRIAQLAESVTGAVCGLQEIRGSLDGLWLTLKVLHPGKIPERPIDQARNGTS